MPGLAPRHLLWVAISRSQQNRHGTGQQFGKTTGSTPFRTPNAGSCDKLQGDPLRSQRISSVCPVSTTMPSAMGGTMALPPAGNHQVNVPVSDASALNEAGFAGI